ncbi:proline dehydrogenase [Salix suchowensis]|nr:proline dehydrogenase [Salix suchowensis]
MAPKHLPPKQLQNLRFFFTRSLRTSSSSSISTSAAVSPLNLAERPEPAIQKPLTAIQDHAKPSSILDIHDHQKLFSNVPTSKLLHASSNLYLASISPMVDFGMWVMNSRLMETDNILRAAMMKTVRHTFFEHFCAGEDVVEAGRCIKKVNESGLRGMLVFAVEYTGDNDACDQNLKGFLDTVQSAMSLPPSSVSSVVVKITAICPLSLLERVSDLLRWQQRHPSFNLPWKQNKPLTPQEEHDLQLGQERLWKLSEKSVQANIPLTVDAENTAIQPAIDYLTYSAAIKYNKDDNPIVYGTIQAYLKDAKERLLLATKAADKMRVPMGFKVVRGAYMSRESKLASALGYDSPIHNSIQETHACYNDCASFMLEKITNRSDAVILATHNVESGKDFKETYV